MRRICLPFFEFELSVRSIFWVCSSCLIRRLTSSTLRPEPAAIRRFREGLSSPGFLLSSSVIERMIALFQSSARSSMSTSSSLLPTPGSFERIPLMGPMPLIWLSWSSISLKSILFFIIFFSNLINNYKISFWNT